jgi:putative IMPACT (imprinted ancient) family translation regulator
MWKMILYWKKRAEMCSETPFIDLDLEKAVRSIKKTSRFFEKKLPNSSATMKDNTKSISTKVLDQVEYWTKTIQFLKQLKSEALKERHWQ